MRRLYNAALLPLAAAAFAYGRWPRRTEGARLERDQRLGRHLPAVAPGAIWIHGASVGEARLAKSLATRLREAVPGRPLAVSAVTPTGRAILPGPPLADAAFYFPLDFPSVQRRAFDALAPGLLLLIETELWPNTLAEARDRGVPVVLANARLAPERFGRYRRLRALYAPMLASLAGVAVPDEAEAERFAALGVPRGTLRITGNLKFEVPLPEVSPDTLRARLRLDPARPVVAAGSTGAGEDTLVLDAYEAARSRVPSLALLLAPRHPARFEEAATAAAARGLAVARASRAEPLEGADVLVVDTIGDLAGLYGIAWAAFVGGTLVPVGGHNLLEPIAAGCTVLFGPETGHVEEMARTLLAAGAAERVPDAASLGAAWVRLIEDGALRQRRLDAGRGLLLAHRGALARTVDLVREVLAA
ncbi:MAG TPA: glycosyltransferase N-terminal domain-containing protein [Candidatus Polarisedimenticolaceae bacterium]|nr:glycosyltransferase N-terminal domain-containing protein [Candidatus Polarisedimenticolaceae bacterium]